jgi:hypothetical protein
MASAPQHHATGIPVLLCFAAIAGKGEFRASRNSDLLGFTGSAERAQYCANIGQFADCTKKMQGARPCKETRPICFRCPAAANYRA